MKNIKKLLLETFYKNKLNLDEKSWDWESEIKKASDEIDKEKRTKNKVTTSDYWTGSSASQVKDGSFADKPVGVRYKGNYGTSYNPGDDEDDESEKIEKPTSDGPRKRGRPAGSLGAAKRAALAHDNDSGKRLQDILLGKISNRLPSNFTTRKIKGRAQSGSTNESTDDLLEMSIGCSKSISGKKVEWIHHPGLGHSVTVDNKPVHNGFVDHKTAALLYAKNIYK